MTKFALYVPLKPRLATCLPKRRRSTSSEFSRTSFQNEGWARASRIDGMLRLSALAVEADLQHGPQRSLPGRSCLRGLRPRAGAVAHPAWECIRAVTAVPDMPPR